MKTFLLIFTFIFSGFCFSDSAKKQVDRQNRAMTLVSLANVGMSIYMFKQCAAESSSSGGGNQMSCMMGLMSLSQAAASMANKKSLSGTSDGLSGGLSFGQSDISPDLCSQSPESCGIASALTGSLTPEQLAALPEALGCPECKITQKEDGELGLVTPEGAKITKSDIDALSPRQKAIMARTLKNNLKNQDLGSSLLSQLEELEEEAEEDEDDKVTIATGKYKGRNPSSSLATGGVIKSRSKRKSSVSGFEKKWADALKKAYGQNKANAKNEKTKSVKIGKTKVGAIQENIFQIITRRYKQKASNNEFINNRKPASI